MKQSKYVVLVVMDGLRQDMVTPEHAPHVCALRERGVWFDKVQTLHPSVTRVVSSSVATGAGPDMHGLFGNSIALFEDGGYTVQNVGAPSFLAHWRSLRGRTLKRPTLAETLAPLGAARIFSNVSPGAAYLQDPNGYGFVYHRAGCFGPGGVALPPLKGIDKGAAGDAALTELCLTALEQIPTPPLSVLWLSEPDDSGHKNPLGSPAHYAALRAADACVGKVYNFLLQRDEDDWLLIVCSDHGQETETGCIDVARELVLAGLKEAVDSRELVVAPNGSAGLLYVAPACKHSIADLRDFFAAQDWCGEIRTFSDGLGPEYLSPKGSDPDGLSPDSTARNDAVRNGISRNDAIDVPALYFSMAKTAQCNPYGVPGGTLAVYDPQEPKERNGCGTHGGLGQYEQNPFLLLCGQNRQIRDWDWGSVISQGSLLDIAPAVIEHLKITRI